jgi:PAS domain S-box-containing protein
MTETLQVQRELAQYRQQSVPLVGDRTPTLRRYERILAANPDPVCLIDTHYRYQVVNPAFQTWSGWPTDLIGHTVSDCFGEAFFTRIAKPRLDQALAGTTQYFEEWAYNPQSTVAQFISITYAPYYEADGSIAGVINSVRDLTALRQTRDRLIQTTEQLQRHIQNSPLAVIEWDHQCRVKDWSPQAVALFGWTAEEVKGRHFSELPIFKEEDHANIQQHIDELWQSETHHCTIMMQTLGRAGQPILGEWYNSALVDEQGQLVSILCLVHDVTERQQTLKALQTSEERWQLALAASNEGIWDWHVVTDTVHYSPQWKKLLGYQPDELPNRFDTWWQRVHPDDWAQVNRVMQRHLRRETPDYSSEFRMRHKDGHYLWILSRGQAIFNDAGEPIRFIGSHTDVSDRKEIELALRHSQELLQLVFDNMPQRVFWKDLEGRIQGGNQSFVKDMGYCDIREVIGKTDAELLALTPAALQRFTDHDRAVIEADQPITFSEQAHRYQDGSVKWLQTVKLPLKSPTGKILGIFGTYEDTTDKALARQSLQRYARMIAASKDAMCLLDTEFRYQIINPSYQDWYAPGGRVILGKTVAEVLGQDAFEGRLKPLLKRCLNGETIRYADWFTFPHLGRRFRSVTLTPYVEALGEITGIVTTISDLTALRESEALQQQLFEIVEATPDLVSTTSPQEALLYLNPALKALITDHADVVVPQQLDQLYPTWALRKIRQEAIPTATHTGTWRGEVALLSSSGQEIPVLQMVTAHLDDWGNVRHFSTIAHDIRPQKQLEQELRDRIKFEQLLSRISTEFVHLPEAELTTGLAQALQAIAEVTGADRSYAYLLSAGDEAMAALWSEWHAEHLPTTPEAWQVVAAVPDHWWIERLKQRQIIRINDIHTVPPTALHERSVMDALAAQSLVIVPMYYGSTLLGHIGFSVTSPKVWSSNEVTLLQLVGDLFANAYHRQRVEQQLRQQEHYFRSLIEQASDMVVLLNAQGQCQYITPAVTRLLGYEPDHLIGRPIVELAMSADVAMMAQTWQQAIAHPGVAQPLIQFRLRHARQDWCYFEAIATSLLHDPAVNGIVINCREVSDRVRAEIAQHHIQQTFQSIFAQSAISMAQIALDGTYIQVNPAFCQLVGYQADELIGEHYAKVTHPEDLAFDTALSIEVATGKVPAHIIDKRFVCADGTVRHVQVTVTAVCDEANQPLFLSSVYNDMTETVVAQNTLRNIVEGTAAVVGDDFFPALARQLAESLAVDHIIISQLETTGQLSSLVFWSHQVQQPTFTYHPQASPCEQTLERGFYCCPTQLQDFFPQDADLVMLNAESYLGVALNSRHGEPLGVLCVLHSKPIGNLDNAVALLRIFAARASAELERQQSLHALEVNETNWRNILDNMPVLLDAIDDNGLVTLWNKECERVTGYTAAEIVNNPNAFQLLYPDQDCHREEASWGDHESDYRDVEWTLTCKDGCQRTVAWSNLSKRYPIPNLSSWGIGVDVTERHRAEQALRKSEARFQRLAANMPGVIYRYHQPPDGHDFFSYVSPGSETLWELSPETIYADSAQLWSLIHADDVNELQASMQQAIARNQPWFHEHRIITASGQLKWIQSAANGVRKPDGTNIWDGLFIDVTARKQAEVALQASEERFQRLAANMPGIIYRYHLDSTGRDYFSYLSPACRELWELEPQIGINDANTVWQLIHPDDRATIEGAMAQSRAQLTPLFEEYRIITPSGVLKWLQMLARPVAEPNGSWLWDGVVIDVTEQRTTQEALRSSEALNRAILDALPDLLIRMRRDGVCLDMQYPSYFQVVCPRDRHIGRRIQDTLEPTVANLRMQAVEAALSTGDIQIYEYEIVINGQSRWEEARVVPMTIDEVLVLIRDVDDRKRAEQALRDSEAVNRAIVKALPDMVVRMTRDGILLTAQHPHSFPAIVQGDEAVGQNIRDILPANVVAHRLADIQRALISRQTQISEYPLQIDDRIQWEESRIVPLTHDEVLVLVRNIDERRQAETEVRRLNQALETQNQRLEELVELRTAELITFMNTLPDQIFVIDRATNRTTFGNDVVVKFADKQTRQEYEGKTLEECFSSERAAYYAAQNQQVFQTGKVLHVEEAIDTAQGVVYLDTYKIPLKRPDGEVYALIGTSRNVTELVQARQALEDQTLQLAATNQELQSFSYSVSHDLRAPLRHVNGFVAALKQRLPVLGQEADPKTAHYIEVIEQSSQKMGLLIDGLLTLSRIGRQEMAWHPVSLRPLVDHAISLNTEFSGSEAQHLDILVDPLPTVHGDAALLQQVLTNLVSNALKFSRDRYPARIQIGQRSEDGAIFVRDNGVGFDMAYADKLFSPFQRLHKADEFEGTGIGLAIVNRIIHRHGGQIWAESRMGHGTTIYFTLPHESHPKELSFYNS